MNRAIVLAVTLVFAVVSCAAPRPPTERPAPAPIEQPTEMPTKAPAVPPATEIPTDAPTEPPAAETANEMATEVSAQEPTPTLGPEATPTQVPPFEPLVGLLLAAEGLTAPVGLTAAGDGSGRLFVVDQIGVIRVLTSEGELLDEPFLDVRDRMVGLNPGYDERGLLGLAFHPDYEQNGVLYVYYSAPLRDGAPAGWNHTSHLSRFSVSAEDANRAGGGSEDILMQVDQPQANHNGGEIAFGPEGYLYVALGDGGGAHDIGTGHVGDWYAANRGGNGQDVTENLLGSILRIDVDGGQPYGIPEGNPFLGRDGLDEIWAYGFRNPYRFSFDSAGDGALFVADVGQNLWEEVSIVTKSGNYGWNVREGAHCFSPATPNKPPETCPDVDSNGNPLADPIIEYQNSNSPGGLGRAVVGGYVYRGEMLPSFAGRYVFGDWSRGLGGGGGTLLVAKRPELGGDRWSFQELEVAKSEDGRLGAFVLAFGRDGQNELYLLTSGMAGPQGQTGKVWKIVPVE